MKRLMLACLAASLATGALPLMAGPSAAEVAPAPAVAAPVAPVAMASHHAVYRLSLLSAKGTKAPSGATGLIDYDFTASPCAGYTTAFRQMTEIQPAEGDSRLNDMRSTTFEDVAAKLYTFKTKTSNDDPASNVDGRAERAADGDVSVDLTQPAGRTSFGPDVLFPTEHLRRVIAAAERGEKILSAQVYDGSDGGKKVLNSLSVIGAPITQPADGPAGTNAATKDLRRWPVVISYFEPGGDQPAYVLTSEIYEDGISRALKLDYGDFILAGDLTDLTVKPDATCSK